MKKLFAFIAAFFVASVMAATTVPVQLLNPAGSSSGQTVVSTGSSTAPGWATLGVANVSGAAPLASPTFTGTVTIPALTMTGAITPSSTAGLVGTTSANNANAGAVGEYVTATSTSTGITNNVTTNITSISITAGDYDVGGSICFNPTAVLTQVIAGTNTTSATFQASPGYSVFNASSASGGGECLATPTSRVNVSTTTTVYLIGSASFSSGTTTTVGTVWARRRR